MIPDKNSTISGEVSFEQENESSPVTIELKVYGAKSVHGFHIHENGSIEGGCDSAGKHYNPLNKKHGGAEDEERHMGDLGNIKTKDHNSIVYSFTNDKVSLFGDYTILGRTCVIHALEDDLGKGTNPQSSETGNSGPKLACGVVQRYDPLYSMIFGFSILVIGMGISFYYFFIYNKNNTSFPPNQLVEQSVRNA
jgi:Cu-Zn family superoxide dismutase